MIQALRVLAQQTSMTPTAVSFPALNLHFDNFFELPFTSLNTVHLYSRLGEPLPPDGPIKNMLEILVELCFFLV